MSSPLPADNSAEFAADSAAEIDTPPTSVGGAFQPRPRTIRRFSVRPLWLVLGAILVLGGILRFNGLDWDQGTAQHPDERAIACGIGALNTVMTTSNGERRKVDFPYGGLSFFLPNGAKDIGAPSELPPNTLIPENQYNFWNGHYSPLAPHDCGTGLFFAYGTLPMYIGKFASWVANTATGQSYWDDYDHSYQVGRFISAAFSLLSVLLLFLLARRVYGGYGTRRAEIIGVIAAAFLSVSMLDVQLAHFLTFDVATTTFVLWTLYVAVGALQSGRRSAAATTGAVFGLGLATKFSSAPLGLAIILALFVLPVIFGRASRRWGWRGVASANIVAQVESRSFGGRAIYYGTNLFVAGATTLIVWFVAMPYAFLDFKDFVERIGTEYSMVNGIYDFPYTRQYVGTPKVWYQLYNLSFYGLGLPLAALGLVGLAFALWQTFVHGTRLKAELVVLSFVLPYMALTLNYETKFNRYMLPITGFLILFAARLIVDLVLRWRRQPDEAVLDMHAGTREVSSFLNRTQPRPMLVYAVLTVAGVAFAWALIWCVSYQSIYDNLHTRVAASQWIEKNIPAGATLGEHHWDESLPTDVAKLNILPSRNGYQNVSFDLYDDRAPNDEVAYLVEQLKKSDYIVETSPRLYKVLPRLPWRYAVAIRFYDLLFSERLGYQKVAEFTSYPTVPVLGLQLNDDAADESWSVYDHPKVTIFKRTQALTDAELRGLMAESAKATWLPTRNPDPKTFPAYVPGSTDGALSSPTGSQMRSATGEKSLMLDTQVDRQPSVNDNGWNLVSNDAGILATITWLLIIEIVGLIGLPIAARVFRRLPDGGYVFAKPLGAALVAFIIWWALSLRLVTYTAWVAWLGMGIAACIAGATLYKKAWWQSFLNGLRTRRTTLIVEEIAFLVAFVAFVLIRAANPDLWHWINGGEKPMEFAFLNGILRSPYMPPFDPWFSDAYINYYYYGQYLVSTWIKLTGIVPAVSYNLAIATLYGFVFSGAFGLVYNLTASYRARRRKIEAPDLPKTATNAFDRRAAIVGLFGAFVVGLSGTFQPVSEVLRRNEGVVNWLNDHDLTFGFTDKTIQVAQRFDFFGSTRVLPHGAIDEFPYWSYLWADLHAHMIALPFTYMLVGIALNTLLGANRRHSNSAVTFDTTAGALSMPTFASAIVRNVAESVIAAWRTLGSSIWTVLVLALILGMVFITNSWDLPTYLLLNGVALLLALFFGAGREDARIRLRLTDIVVAGGVTGAILLVALLLYRPFFDNFQNFYGKIEITDVQMPVSGFMAVFGLSMYMILSFVVWDMRQWLRQSRTIGGAATLSVVVFGLLLLFALITQSPYALCIFMVALVLALAGLLLLRPLALSWVTANPPIALTPNPSPADGRGEQEPVEEGFSLDTSTRPVGDDFSLETPTDSDVDTRIYAPKPGNADNAAQLSLWPDIANSREAPTPAKLTAHPTPSPANEGGQQERTNSPAPMKTASYASLAHGERGRGIGATDLDAPGVRDPQLVFARLLVITGAAIVAGTQIVYLVDFLHGLPDGKMMNTIFKFYYQVWTLFGVAGAFVAYVLWREWVSVGFSRYFERAVSSMGMVGRYLWLVFAALIITASGMFVLAGTPARIQDRDDYTSTKNTGLDGQAFMRGSHWPANGGGTITYKWDDLALRDFFQKLPGSPVIMEGVTQIYRSGGSRIASYSGLPSVLGWDNHEEQQRYSFQTDIDGKRGYIEINGKATNRACDPSKGTLNCVEVKQIALRRDDIAQVYQSGDIAQTLRILSHYHVTYLYVGQVEKLWQNGDGTPYMSDDAIAKLNEMVKLGLLKVAYQNPGATAYQLTLQGQAGVLHPEDTTSVLEDASVISTVTGSTGGIVDRKEASLRDRIERDPDDSDAHYQLGDMLQTRKDYAGALAEFQEVIRIKPNDLNPYHRLGDVYGALGQDDAAMAAYKKGTEVAAYAPAAFLKYGIELSRRSLYSEARAALLRVTQLDQNFIEGYLRLGEVLEKIGDKDGARIQYTAAVQRAKPNDAWAKDAAQHLKDMK